ncbi:MAG: hypothetical protein CM1200mP30_18040 [Pseudomonadota bacterium]|nr:MAG: hypothetical protein CM1200mP30_18040 [Pseudomonadota bacterium]
MMMIDMKAGLGPIKIHTDVALQKLSKTHAKKEIRHLESEAWEDFLDMTITQAASGPANNMARKKSPRTYALRALSAGSHAGCAGYGPADQGILGRKMALGL